MPACPPARPPAFLTVCWLAGSVDFSAVSAVEAAAAAGTTGARMGLE